MSSKHVSQGSARHRAIPATNVVGLVCFDRLLEQLEDPQELIKSIHQEIERIRSEHIGLIFPACLRVLRYWPRKLAAGIRRKRFSGTVLFSNLGPALTNCHLERSDGKIVLGDGLTVESFEFMPVLRPGHYAVLAASSYGARISVTMNYDERLLSPEEAASLFHEYTEGSPST